MVYKAIKRIYPITTILGFCVLFVFTSISDFHTKVSHSITPEIAYSFMVWGLVLMIPAGLFAILDYIKDKYIDRKE